MENKPQKDHPTKVNALTFMRRYFVSIFFALIALACLLYVAKYLYQTAKARRFYSELQTAAAATAEPSSSSSVSASAPVVIPIDFAALQQENSDIYAWIRVEGTGIDYPILQNADDTDYYLEHNLDGSEGLPGALYTQNFQAQDFSDYNTVVYGHNMKDDSMFGTLHDYENDDTFSAASYITVYTVGHRFTYQVFAAEQYSDVLIPAQYDFTTPEGRQAYLDSLKELTLSTDHYDDTVPVTAEDKLITLSTCEHNSDHEHRYIVVGVLVSEE